MKIAIVGAGICGLYLAWKLAERGEDVTVFEKRNKVGKEACSGLFSDRILGFIPESKNLIQNHIEYALVHFPRRTLKVEFSRNFFVMSHYELDNLVADLAQRAGAKILFNSNLLKSDINRLGRGEENKFSSSPTKASAEVKKKESSSTSLPYSGSSVFDRIIGCDGALSETRKSLKLKDPEFYSGIQGIVKEIDNSNSNYVETWATKNGFIWRIPRGKEAKNVYSSPSSPRLPDGGRGSITEWGIMEKPKGANLLFDSFLAKNNIKLVNIKSSLIPQGLIIPQSEKIALCGDAAGLTKPWSGGGVVWGLTGADLLLKTFPDFIQYQKELKKFFWWKIAFAKLIKKAVYFFGFNFPWILPKKRRIESDFLPR